MKNTHVLILVSALALIASNQAHGALSAPTLAPGFNNSIGAGVSVNVGNQDSIGFGLSLIDYSRRIHGPWSITVGLGFDKKWTEKTDGTEQTDSYSISSTVAYDVKKLELLGAPASMSVFAGAAQDFSNYNAKTGRRDEELGSAIGGGVSFA